MSYQDDQLCYFTQDSFTFFELELGISSTVCHSVFEGYV